MSRIVSPRGLSILMVTIAAFLLAAGPSLVQAQTTAPQFTTVLAAAQALNLTSLIAAVRAANLTSAFSDAKLQAIVLAPTNAAFAAANFTGASVATLTRVLTYHVLPQNTSFASLLNKSQSFRSLLGTVNAASPNTTTNVTAAAPINGLAYLAAVSPGGLTNLSVSVTAALSRVYLVDSVLLPPSLAVIPDLRLTVAAAAVATPALSTLTALVVADAEILAILSNPDLAVTVFAPTNDAFTALLKSLNTTAAAVRGTALAKQILKNHVLVARPFTTAQFASGVTTFATAEANEFLTVTRAKNASAGGAFATKVAASGNTVPATVAATVVAGKSVILVVDTVLVSSVVAGEASLESSAETPSTTPSPTHSTNPPPSPLTVAAAALATPTLSTLAALMIQDPTVLAVLSNPNLNVTIFAPTDAAFAALLKSLNTTVAALKGTPLAQRVLLNHVLPEGPLTSAQFPAGNSTHKTAVTTPEFLIVNRARVASADGTFTLKVFAAQSTANVVVSVPVGKSVVHILDGVLVPSNVSSTPSPSRPSPKVSYPGSSTPGTLAASAAGMSMAPASLMAAAVGAALMLLMINL